MKIEKFPHNNIRITGADGGFIKSSSVEANLLFAILKELKEIKKSIGEDTYRSITAKDIKI